MEDKTTKQIGLGCYARTIGTTPVIAQCSFCDSGVIPARTEVKLLYYEGRQARVYVPSQQRNVSVEAIMLEEA